MARYVNRSAWARRLLGADQHMRIRVAMTGVSALLSMVCGGLVILLAYAGFARVDLSLLWIGTLVLFNLGVLVCIRTGWTQRLDDPALTQLQIRYAILSNAAGYALLGEARGITPVILSLVLMFGIFNLSARQMLANLLLSLLCFGIAMAVVFWTNAPGHNAVLELAYGVMVVLVLLGSTFVGLRIQHVRERLKRQKHALGAALQRINHLATHDDLTGLVNRRRMTELLTVERERCERSGRPLVLALLDLDLFKRINDQHGHAVGDAALCAFAQEVEKNLRSTDVLARWGGEEFLLLMPETSIKGALALLERVRGDVAGLCLETAMGSIRITVSAGLAAGRRGQTLEQVLEQADEALYQAKEQGRDRVVLHAGSHWAELMAWPDDTLAASEPQAAR
jgi:diguanylate cyclase (GGDEF)-like protein